MGERSGRIHPATKYIIEVLSGTVAAIKYDDSNPEGKINPKYIQSNYPALFARISNYPGGWRQITEFAGFDPSVEAKGHSRLSIKQGENS